MSTCQGHWSPPVPARGDPVRRRLHGFLVGVLTCSLAFDTAQACGHRRRGCHVRPCLAVPAMVPCGVACPTPGWTVVPAGSWCPPVTTTSCGPWTTWAGPVSDAAWGADCAPAPFMVVESGCGGWVTDGQIVGGELSAQCCVGHEVVMAETTSVETPVVEVAPESVVVESPTAAASAAQPILAESIVAPAAEPAAGLVPLAPAPQAVPDLQAVEPASATEPAGEVELPPAELPAVVAEPSAVEATPEPIDAEPPRVAPPDPAVQEPSAAPVPAAEPVEENLFEEVTRDPDAATPSALPAAEPTAAGAEPVEPAAVGEPVPPAAESEPAAAEPALPAVEPGELEQEPEPAGADAAALEPLRRWIDSSGRYATVGALVAVRGAAVEIRTAAGRAITVPLARLSEFDRGYADAAALRVAARVPSERDTAGL